MSSITTLVCRNHPNLQWTCKAIAVDTDGRYNHSRNLFFSSETGTECNCDASYLVAIDQYNHEDDADRSIALKHINTINQKETIMQVPANASPAVHAAVQAALIQAGITEENNEIHEFCAQTKNQIAFQAASIAGKICTRIQRLQKGRFSLIGSFDCEEHFKEYGKYPDGTKEECKHEMISMARDLNWRLNHAPDEIITRNGDVTCGGGLAGIVAPMVEQWLGGGFVAKAKEEKIAGYIHLGHTIEEARQMAAQAACKQRDDLAVSRESLGTTMIGKLVQVLEANEAAIPEDIEQIFQSAYDFAVSGGRVAEAILVKHDATMLGYNVKKTIINNDNAGRAQEIREKLARMQQARADEQAKSLAEFDPMAA